MSFFFDILPRDLQIELCYCLPYDDLKSNRDHFSFIKGICQSCNFFRSKFLKMTGGPRGTGIDGREEEFDENPRELSDEERYLELRVEENYSILGGLFKGAENYMNLDKLVKKAAKEGDQKMIDYFMSLNRPKRRSYTLLIHERLFGGLAMYGDIHLLDHYWNLHQDSGGVVSNNGQPLLVGAPSNDDQLKLAAEDFKFCVCQIIHQAARFNNQLLLEYVKKKTDFFDASSMLTGFTRGGFIDQITENHVLITDSIARKILEFSVKYGKYEIAGYITNKVPLNNIREMTKAIIRWRDIDRINACLNSLLLRQMYGISLNWMFVNACIFKHLDIAKLIYDKIKQEKEKIEYFDHGIINMIASGKYYILQYYLDLVISEGLKNQIDFQKHILYAQECEFPKIEKYLISLLD